MSIARGALSGAVLTAGLIAAAGDAVADDTAETWRTSEAYIACGRNYVDRALRPTLEGAESMCATELEAYVAAMRTLVLNAMAEEGMSAERAQAFVAHKEAEARNEARSSFDYSVQQLIAERQQ
jgi:hypothetical protein